MYGVNLNNHTFIVYQREITSLWQKSMVQKLQYPTKYTNVIANFNQKTMCAY